MPRSRSTALARALIRAGVTDVLTDEGNRSAYASDASLYRVRPQAVVRPRSLDEVAATLDVCRALGVPLTSRGAGTSVAGNAVGPGVVVDFSRHLNKVLDVDVSNRLARVQPGAVPADLQQLITPYGLRFGPDPSTHTRCTIGGMIGNNACGARTLSYGRTSDNVAGLELMCADGGTLSTGYDAGGRPICRGSETLVETVRQVMGRHLATARTEFGRFGRQVSGYAAQHLLPESHFDLTRALVGSEGTLAIVSEATVRLVRDPAQRVLVALGFPDIVAAGDAALAVLEYRPTACEGLDSRIVDVIRARRGADAVPPLPAGGAWLFVEIAGDDRREVLDRAGVLRDSGLAREAVVVDDALRAAAAWRIREDGAGLAGRAPSGRPAYAGWEDAAVPPAFLGRYLRRFDELVSRHGMTSMPYGHFADGCIHVRLDFPFDRQGGAVSFRAFLLEAAELVSEFGGSLSGEHGDGRARGELLPKMYSPDALLLFRSIKGAFDPGNLLNPGVLVDPDPVDARLRLDGPLRLDRQPALAYAHDGGDFVQAVHRCTGVGKCRADNRAAGGVMCPSFAATREEIHSTRGRARILQEMVRGESPLSWRSHEVHEALDLCLACKGCASDCPTGVDVAAYKSEVLHQAYRRRLRPRTHYTLGWLPRWSRLASLLPAVANRALTLPVLGRLALFLAGVDPRRSMPRFAPTTLRRASRASAGRPSVGGKPVLLFVDSFTDHFSPGVATAVVDVLRSAGHTPRLTRSGLCCGLTWITTGQLSAARRILGRTVRELATAAREGTPIVGIEPSCTGVLRGDALELLDNDDARAVAAATITLAELLGNDPDWTAPDLSGTTIVAQPHCHHHAVMGWDRDAELLATTGATVERLAGCCGLAGNFGVERGHYEVSVAVAEQSLLPAVRAARTDAVIVADGFSCRTQIADLTERTAMHLAEVLASRLP